MRPNLSEDMKRTSRETQHLCNIIHNAYFRLRYLTGEESVEKRKTDKYMHDSTTFWVNDLLVRTTWTIDWGVFVLLRQCLLVERNLSKGLL